MKKLVATAAMAAFSVVLISGCASTPAAESKATPAATFVSPIPKLDSAQEASLTSELAKINPLLVNDKTVDNARNQCTTILGASDEAMQITAAKTRFTARKMTSVSDSEAKQIIAVIKANGFCKTVS